MAAAPRHRGGRFPVFIFLLLALALHGSRADAFKQPRAVTPAPTPPTRTPRPVKAMPPSSPRRPRGVMEPVGRRGGAVDPKQLSVPTPAPAPMTDASLRPAVTGAVVLVLATTAFFVLFGGGVDAAWAAGGAPGIDTAAILKKAGKRAMGGGASGAAASLVQLVTLGWLRTSMNYQYKNGGTLGETIGKLYKEGGVARFYQGLSVAALQLPLSRFGDVAANAFVLALLDSLDATRDLPIPLKTGVLGGCFIESSWRR